MRHMSRKPKGMHFFQASSINLGVILLNCPVESDGILPCILPLIGTNIYTLPSTEAFRCKPSAWADMVRLNWLRNEGLGSLEDNCTQCIQSLPADYIRRIGSWAWAQSETEGHESVSQAATLWVKPRLFTWRHFEGYHARLRRHLRADRVHPHCWWSGWPGNNLYKPSVVMYCPSFCRFQSGQTVPHGPGFWWSKRGKRNGGRIMRCLNISMKSFHWHQV